MEYGITTFPHNYHPQIKAVFSIMFLVFLLLAVVYKYTCSGIHHNEGNRYTLSLSYRDADIDVGKGLYHTYNKDTPFVADAVVVDDNGWYLIVLLSATHLPRNTPLLLNGSYSLICREREYQGERMVHTNGFITMKYSIPVSAISEGSTLRFSLMNNATGQLFPDCSARVLPYSTKGGIATCSFATKYDSFYDVAYFISYTLSVGVDTVILYVSARFPYLPVLHHIYGKRLKVFVFSWPLRNKPFGHFDSLIAQLNSCYYRNRDRYQYLIMIDLDEMILNHTNDTLLHLIDTLLKSPAENGIQVSVIRSMNCS